MPRVSVIVPNYNHEPYLRRRLDTIFNQTYQDFEVLLLDDCSTDNSRVIIEAYQADPRAKIVLNTSNSGSPFKQWNKGFNLAHGEYVWIAESDDFAELEFLAQMLDVFDKEPDVGLVYCQSWMMPVANSASRPQIFSEWYASFRDCDRWERNYTNSGMEELANYLVFKNTIPNASAVVFRRSLIEDGLRAPAYMRLMGDWMFWAQLALRTRIGFLATPLNYFRVAHPESQRLKTQRDGSEVLEGLDVYRFIDENLELSAETKRRVLDHQVKLWGSIALHRSLGLDLNRSIYRKLVSVHPQAGSRRLFSIWIPFALYVATARVRRISWLSRGLRAIRYWANTTLKRALLFAPL